jgi:hypothetical protein
VVDRGRIAHEFEHPLDGLGQRGAIRELMLPMAADHGAVLRAHAEIQLDGLRTLA